MPPRIQVTAPERRALDKLWAENPAGRTKLYASARAAGLNAESSKRKLRKRNQTQDTKQK